MFLYIRKTTGETAMRSESRMKVDLDIFEEQEVLLNEEDKQKLEENWQATVEEGEITFEKPPEVIVKEQIIKKEDLLRRLEIPDLTLPELQEVVRELCELLP